MSENRQIRTDTLDFLDIKENLKDFLRGQNRFTDFDFDGSVLSTLLDVLAYNTHYNALYTNMAVNESFLDSASKYSSVVSLAKSLGYTARSVRSARARLNITITNDTAAAVLTIPKGTIFKTSVGDNIFDFIANSDYTARLINGVYNFPSVDVIEGTIITRRIDVTSTSKYVIPNLNADITTLDVRVQEAVGSSVHTKFSFAANSIDIKQNDNVFFVKQREDLLYEVHFGDGNIGSRIFPGNVVHLDYIISSGPRANSARVFTYSSGIQQFTNIEIQTVLSATGGAEAESAESIKFNAPLLFAAQNRAVTANDYIAVINQLFPSIESVTVWGGQEHVPKSYGKVFIAIKPNGSDTFSEAEKNDIKQVLMKRAAIVTVIPEIVDPVYLRIELTTNVHYNPILSRRTAGEIATSIRNTIANYSTLLGKFGAEFRLSRLSSLIDSADNSIISNSTTLRIRRTVIPSINRQANYTIRFANPVYQRDNGGGFYSTRFFFEGISDRCFMKDNGGGLIELYSEDINGIPAYIRNVGTINYSTGTISIPNMFIRGLFDPILEFVITPSSNDVIPIRDHIIQLPNNLVTVNTISDRVAAGDDKSTFIFSNVR